MSTSLISTRTPFFIASGRRRALAAPLATLALSVVALGACESTQQRVAQKEDALAAAGFEVKPANR